MDNTQSNSSLQPTGTNPSTTNNPQQNVQGSLQPQADSNLQPTTNQSVDSINQLDQGSVAIPVSGIPNTTATEQSVTATPATTKPVILYGFGVIICAVVLAWLLYDWLWPKADKSEAKVEAEPAPVPKKAAPAKAKTSKPKKSKKSKKRKKR